jgi:homoserine O-acetyltransferase
MSVLMSNTPEQTLGTVGSSTFTCCQPPHELRLKSGEKLGPITQVYETYGELNADKSNAILIFHSLTGDAHAAGYYAGDKNPGWWDGMIGPGKAFDTNKYFMICANVIGSCKGSTGPASINPKTGRPYGLSFPMVTIEDMVVAQKLLIDHLGIKKLLCAAGGSMGGLSALKWAVLYPQFVQSVITIACNHRHTAQQIALHEVCRQAIMSDPDWQGGDYYGKSIPARGMALSRMIGHITYMSEKSMDERFGRKLIGKEKVGYDFSHDFEVESYLKYRGDSFVQRFDANSYLYLTKCLDYFDLAEEGDLAAPFRKCDASFLIISFTSDWLYPSYQAKELIRALKSVDLDVSDIEINTNYGHDAFLVETQAQSHMIKHFLTRMENQLSNRYTA